VVRIAAMVAIASGLLLASGCGGGSTSARTQSSAAEPAPAHAYLSALSAAQSRLAASERAIPRRPKTPRALARAISLLQSAIRGLGTNLAAIHPPASVAALHAQLVAHVNAYAARLTAAARTAARPGGELKAANLLSSATDEATRDFGTTLARIDQALGATR
jgi:hypothetical protein